MTYQPHKKLIMYLKMNIKSKCNNKHFSDSNLHLENLQKFI